MGKVICAKEVSGICAKGLCGEDWLICDSLIDLLIAQVTNTGLSIEQGCVNLTQICPCCKPFSALQSLGH